MSSIPEKEKYAGRKDFRRVTAIWWTITILVVAIMIWGSTFNLRGLSVYMGLWLVISLLCWYFSVKWTFNNYLGLLPNILEIPVYISLTMMVLISLFGAAPYFNDKYLLRQLSSVDELPIGLVLTGVGLISMWLGYWVVVQLWRGKSKNDLEDKHRQQRFINIDDPSLARTAIVYLILIGLRVFLFYSGGGERYGKTLDFGDFNQWIIYPLQLRWFFLALVTLNALNGRWPRFFAFFVIGFEVFMSVVTGWSSSLLKIALIVAGCMLYSINKLSVRTVVTSGLIFLAALISLTPISRFYRTVNNSSLLNTITALSEGFGNIQDSNANLIYTSDLLVARQTATAQTPSLFLKLTPTYVPYRPIEDLLLVPFSIIPRVIWPNKPEYSRLGGIITQDYFGIYRLNPSASASTLSGSAYIYGGWLVVPISMSILGIVSALLYALVAFPAIKRENVGLLALYIGVVITNFHIGEGDILGLWQGLFQATLFFLAFLALLCIGKKRQA